MTRLNSLHPVLSKLFVQLRTDPLFRNSFFLMSSTAVQAGLGFLFWILCAKLFSAEQIGIGGSLISAVTFLSYISLLGFNSTLIRFLPNAKDANQQISSSIILVLVASFLISTVYVVLLRQISEDLFGAINTPVLAFSFILLSMFSAANLLTDSIFIATRTAHFNLAIYTIQSSLKLLLPIILVSLGGFGVFAAVGIAASLAFLLSILFASKWLGIRYFLNVDKTVVARFWKFSSSNYVANLANMVPVLAMPTIVLNRLGAENAGYFYLAFTICSLLYAVAYAVSQSLFAEGSYGDESLSRLFFKAGKLVLGVMIPASGILAIGGRFILYLFNGEYQTQTYPILVVLAITGPSVGIYVLGTVLLRISGKGVQLIAVNILYATIICLLSAWWAQYGLTGVGWAWFVGNTVAGFFALLQMKQELFPRTK